VWTPPWLELLDRLRMDVRQAWRAWRRVPLAALAMIVLTALGTGGVVALFTPLYSLVLAPLPFS
jgi:NhaP-type Na+/H+ or K+/H+ antiporter